MVDHVQPSTTFAWPIYADATLAGLAVLVPVPGLDWWLERLFRQRMPGAIAQYRQTTLRPDILDALMPSSRGCASIGLGLLFKVPVALIKRLSRKILYVLTIKDAANQLSYYWQRAFLLDHMLTSGHLATPPSARIARQAMEDVLATSPTPLTRLARTVVRSSRDVWRTLQRARQGHETEVLPQQQAAMQQEWGKYEAGLQALATSYDRRYHQRMRIQTP